MSFPKILTAAQMREVDRRTIESGIPGIVLMENAAMRVVEFLEERFGPLRGKSVVVFCGKGNNGGDGLAISRQLLVGARVRALSVLLACSPDELTGDAASNYRMFVACGGRLEFEIRPEMRSAALVIDALLGTGLGGAARGKAVAWIRAINQEFSAAKVVAVDVPSGMPSDSGAPSPGEVARADATVTFTALKPCHALSPNSRIVGDLRIAQIGSPASLYAEDPDVALALVEPAGFAHLLAARDPAGNKGSYGHVLVVGGSRGKTGAPAMSGLGALRAGAGLVTVASAGSAIPVIASHAAELMTEFLPETSEGAMAESAADKVSLLMEKCSVLAIGPGLGEAGETAAFVASMFSACPKPVVADADALNILAASQWPELDGKLRILTPHPGEMARLIKASVKEVQADRIACARRFAVERKVVLVLKGERTLIAFPDGNVWVNPTGSPSMATGGTGDILTGMVAAFLGQFPSQPELAVAAAVWLHGRAGQIGADALGEQSMTATDLLRFLPEAMREARNSDSIHTHWL